MNRILHHLAACTFTAIALIAAPAAHGTTALRPLTIAELSGRSDVILHGTIRFVASEMVAGRGIFTRIEVTPLEAWKGAVDGNASLYVYGGSWEDLTTVVEGWPCLDQDEEVVLFLVRNGPETFDLVNLAEGKFSVRQVNGAPSEVSRDLEGISYLDPAVPITMPTDLDGLRDAVRQANR